MYFDMQGVNLCIKCSSLNNYFYVLNANDLYTLMFKHTHIKMTKKMRLWASVRLLTRSSSHRTVDCSRFKRIPRSLAFEQNFDKRA